MEFNKDSLKIDAGKTVADLSELILKQIRGEMGRLKAKQNVSTLQPHRWQEILDDRLRIGRKSRLADNFVLSVMQSIHEEAIRQQEVDRGVEEADQA